MCFFVVVAQETFGWAMPRFKKTQSDLLWRKLGLRTLRLALTQRPRKNASLHWGNYGIQALHPITVTQEHIDRIDILLRTMIRRTDPSADTQFFLNFWFPVTKKSAGQRMGGGIGKNSHTIAPIRAGEIFCQIRTDYPMAAVHAYKCVKQRMRVRTRLVRYEYKGELVKRFAPTNKELVDSWKVVYK